MIRPFLTEITLFLTPFAVFAIFLWATRAGALDKAQWTLTRLVWLLMVALILMIGSFLALAHWGGDPPNSTYIPAHYENGVFVPGQTE
jgi:uncharacterized protein DUF6111